MSENPAWRIEDPEVDEAGEERHPAFGLAGFNRVQATPGAVLFDSDIRHSSYVKFTLTRARRRRDLNRDWLFGDDELIEIAMSEAQFGALVSSFGSGSGVPVTIKRTPDEVFVPNLPFESRLNLSAQETRDTAERMYDKVRAALDAVEEKPTKANIRTLRNTIDNVGPNVKYAAESLTKHVENVVTKAKVDIEGMVTQHAQHLGLERADLPVLALEASSDTIATIATEENR